jgi:hypothetical protein
MWCLRPVSGQERLELAEPQRLIAGGLQSLVEWRLRGVVLPRVHVVDVLLVAHGTGDGSASVGTPSVRPVYPSGRDEARGNPVGFRDCPAAVSGNDRRHDALGVSLGSDGQ